MLNPLILRHSLATLSGFAPIPISVESNQTALSPVLESVEIHDPEPTPGAPELFYRLRLSQVPEAP